MSLLEPDSGKLFPHENDDVRVVALLSLAISMKRIADVMAGDGKHSSIIDVVYDVVSTVRQR